MAGRKARRMRGQVSAPSFVEAAHCTAWERPDEGIGPYKKAFYRRPLIRLAFGQPPFPIPSGLRPSPLDKGSRPPGPHLRGPQLGDQGSQRKGAGGSTDWLPFYYRCR